MKCIRRTVFVVPEEDVTILGRLQATLSWLDEGHPMTASNTHSIRLGLSMIQRMRPVEVYEPVTERETVEVEA